MVPRRLLTFRTAWRRPLVWLRRRPPQMWRSSWPTSTRLSFSSPRTAVRGRQTSTYRRTLMTQDHPTRRDMLKDVVYVTPAIFTLTAVPAFESSRSSQAKVKDKVKDQVKGKVKDQVKGKVKDQVKKVKDQVKKVKDQVKKVKDQVKNT